MNNKIAFIGAGNMGGAIVQAVCKVITPSDVIIFDHNTQIAQELSEKTGCSIATDAKEAVDAAQNILICVRPQIFAPVLTGIIPYLKEAINAGEEKVVLSLAASVSIQMIEDLLGESDLSLPVIRILPNTPAIVGQGMLLVAPNSLTTDAQCQTIIDMLSESGIVERSDEQMIDNATSLYSCSPAFVYMFIEALSDAGVQIGVPRDKAIRYAAQGVLGAAAMVLESGEHPGVLKDNVCSPGGITIVGVSELEKQGFRNAAISAILACDERHKDMNK